MQAEVGAIVDGKVTGLTDFGAFVEIEEGKTGMVHISEVAAEFVNNIRDHLTINQEVKVKILNIGDDGKISLSIKKTMEPAQRAPRPRQNTNNRRSNSAANVWQGTKSAKPTDSQSFEDMMTRFKQVSDEKMTDLKRSSDSKRSGGYSRRGGKQ
ncbi:MAG TPA: S1 RNA-binding domain-containing protein [Clostridia bacterium]|nr:S1 RNA-binding domain-containing protein [Clostridia bacterium]